MVEGKDRNLKVRLTERSNCVVCYIIKWRHLFSHKVPFPHVTLFTLFPLAGSLTIPFCFQSTTQWHVLLCTNGNIYVTLTLFKYSLKLSC